MIKCNKFSNFYSEYGRALDNREAALFIGAGLSAGTKLKTWPELLREVADDLKLDINKETDLVALAQFHVNEKRGVRTRLNQLLRDTYGADRPLTENHRLIAKLPVETVWTTNYDQLLEKAFREAGKLYDSKVTTGDFSTTERGREVTIYKMHGDITHPQEAVLTKEDYEVYNIKREVFTNTLKGDLVNKNFLFLGFSFTDPNIDYILSRIRVLMWENPRQHYCVMKWPSKPKSRKKEADYEYEMRKLQLRTDDLKRYGIEALMVNEFSEITELLEELNKQAFRKHVFVSGSAHEYAPMTRERVEKLARMIGERTIREGFNLVSGLGLGVGGAVLIGAMEEVYRDDRAPLLDRVIMRPFPQLSAKDPKRAETYTKYRNDLLSTVGYAVFLCGNKEDPHSKKVVLADGVIEEFEIAKALGRHPIPIGATGHAAKKIWDEVSAAPEKYFPGVDVRKQLKVLGDAKKSDKQLVDAVFEIIRETQGRPAS
ncbi:MAG TPA: SIR2 family protein [Pyrinomonadaceae bacterium]|jgi:hypothetical protein